MLGRPGSRSGSCVAVPTRPNAPVGCTPRAPPAVGASAVLSVGTARHGAESSPVAWNPQCHCDWARAGTATDMASTTAGTARSRRFGTKECTIQRPNPPRSITMWFLLSSRRMHIRETGQGGHRENGDASLLDLYRPCPKICYKRIKNQARTRCRDPPGRTSTASNDPCNS